MLTSAKFAFQLTAAQAATVVDNAFGPTILGSTTGLLPDVQTVDLSLLYTNSTNGFPNGRRLRDDVTDALFSLFSNGKLTTDNVADDNGIVITDGLGGAGATIAFPYLGRPNSPAGGPNP
jgi:hypothetical protein